VSAFELFWVLTSGFHAVARWPGPREFPGHMGQRNSGIQGYSSPTGQSGQALPWRNALALTEWSRMANPFQDDGSCFAIVNDNIRIGFARYSRRRAVVCLEFIE